MLCCRTKQHVIFGEPDSQPKLLSCLLRDVYLHPTLKSYTTGAPSLFSSIKLFSESSVDQSWHWIGGNAVERVSIEAFSSRCANALANNELDALMGEAK